MLQSSSQHSDSSPFRGQGSLVGCGVNAAGKPAYDCEPRVGDLIGDLFRALQSIMGSMPGTDDSHRVMVPQLEVAPDIENRRRIVDLAQ